MPLCGWCTKSPRRKRIRGCSSASPTRPSREDDAINKGIEVQIQDTGDDYHCTGVLYSMTKAKARPYKPAGEWNTLEIQMRGPRTIVRAERRGGDRL